jgi:hypothetical protein
VSEVLGARDRGGQDDKVCLLFANLLNDLVGYHDAYVFMFFCGGSGIFIFNVFGVLLAGVRQLVSSKEVGEWAHVSKSFTLPPLKKNIFSGVYYFPKFTNYISLTAIFNSNRGVLSS